MLSLPVIAVDPRVSVSAVNSGALAYLKDHPSYSAAPFGGGIPATLTGSRQSNVAVTMERQLEETIRLLDLAGDRLSVLVATNELRSFGQEGARGACFATAGAWAAQHRAR